MKIPVYKHRVPLAGPSGARVQPVTTAARAVSQFGQALTQAGLMFEEKYRKARMADQLQEASLGVTEDFNNFMLNMEKDPEYEKYEEKFIAFKDATFKRNFSGITDREAQKIFKNDFDSKALNLEYQVKHRAQQLGANHMKVKSIDRRNRIISMGGGQEAKDALKSELDSALAVGNIFKDDYEIELKNGYYGIALVDAENGAMRIMTTEGIEPAKAWLYSKDAPKISLDDRKIIEKRMQTEWDEWENRIEKERQMASDKAQEYLWDLLRQGKTENYKQVIDNQPIEVQGASGKLAWEKRFDAWIKADKKAREDDTKSTNEKTDEELFLNITKKILDPAIDEFEIKNEIQENTGADESGKARLSATDAEKLTSWVNEHKDNPVFKQALNMFNDAFDEGYVREPHELAEMTNEYAIKVSSGDYTPAGLIQEAENMLALKSHEYISDKLEKFKEGKKLFKKRETPEEYVARHPPGKKPLPQKESGNITDFMEWKNLTDRKSIKTTPIGDTEAHEFDGVWYTKIRGKWYIADLKNNTWNPYKREK